MSSCLRTNCNMTAAAVIILIMAVVTTTVLGMQAPMRLNKRPFCNTFTGCGEKRSTPLQVIARPQYFYRVPEYSANIREVPSAFGLAPDNPTEIPRFEYQISTNAMEEKREFPPVLTPYMHEKMYGTTKPLNGELQAFLDYLRHPIDT